MPGARIESLIAEAHSRLRDGSLDAAAEVIAAAAALAPPQDADLLHLRGLLALQRGDTVAAASLLTEAVWRRPFESRFHGNLAVARRRAGDSGGAEAAYRNAVALEPERAEYHANLANLLKEQGRVEAAETAYRRALALAPGNAKIAFNLGNLLHDQLQLDAAERLLRRAAAIGDETASAALTNLGRVLEKLGRRAEARACYEQVLAAQPDHVAARWNRALLLLQDGDLAAGFRDYEWRWRLPEHPPRPFGKPVWQGDDISGATLLVHAEQGFGDTIQFSRYLPLLAGRAGRVVFECQPPLTRLMARSFPQVTVIATGEATAFDRHIPLLSLPLLLGTRRLGDVPGGPYLRAEPLAPPAGRQVLTVGLVWAGSPGHNLHSILRSIPPADLQPLLRVAGVRFAGLQVGEHAAQCAELGIADLSPQLGDFADTADYLAGLDLVITIDTAVAHLAGALGKPVWILLRAAPDWRWLVDRCDTPWYPTAVLFRQKQMGQWRSLIERVAARLADLVRQNQDEGCQRR